MVEVGAAEDEFAEPVDERLAVVQGDPFPMPHHIAAKRAARLDDATVGRQFHEIEGLLVVEVAVRDERQLHRRRHHALPKVIGREREVVAKELEDVVVP